MSKRSIYTTITPLPVGVGRQTVLETLHTHVEMIDLNPLVEERHPIKAPPHATPEEFHCQWYELTDKIQYLPGGLYSGKVTYTACFHDLANGVQTHIYAPMGLDIRGKWTIGGSLPGEPQAPVEMGKGIPLTGLYLQEDTDMKCSVFLTKFVRKNLKNSHAALVARLLVKAQLQEAALNNDRMSEISHGSNGLNSPHLSYIHPSSTGSIHRSPLGSPGMPSPGYANSMEGSGRSHSSQGTYGPAPAIHPSYPAPPAQFDPRSSPSHGYGGLSPGYTMDPAYAASNPYLQAQMMYPQMQAPLPPLPGQFPSGLQGYDPRLSYAPTDLASHNTHSLTMEDAQLVNRLHNTAPLSSIRQDGASSKKTEKKKETTSSAGPPAYSAPAVELPAELPN
jgi:hypothetical protein